jgi:hypothetical protein
MLCVPKGAYLRLGAYSNTLYVLIIRGWTTAGERVVIHELCQRCQKSLKTVRRGLTEGRRLGWIKSAVDFDGATRYTRHAPGPYIPVVDAVELSPLSVAHKIFILSQINPNFRHVDFSGRYLPYSRSAIYAAFMKLRELNLIDATGINVSKDLLGKSLRAANPPKQKSYRSKAELEAAYSLWVTSGRQSLDSYDIDMAAKILLMHYRKLCLEVESINFAVDGTKIADLKEVLRWLSCDPSLDLESDEVRRLRAITGAHPFDVALLAVESLFTKYFSGFTYDFKVLFKLTEDKNHFDRFILSTFLKAKKNPHWRDPVLRVLVNTENNIEEESYDDFKRRILSRDKE